MITIEPPSTSSILGEAGVSKSALTRFLNLAQARIGLAGEVHVLLTSDAELTRLNRVYRKANKPTDVLSFPAFDPGSGTAGDLAISLDTAARQAAAFEHSLRDELRVLILHGLLHLSGLDHESDSGEMAAQEASLREELHLPATLIARVEGPRGISQTRQQRKKAVPR